MRRARWILAGLVLFSVVCLNNGATAQNKVLRARAVIEGYPGSGISGEIVFTQNDDNFPEPTVDIVARIEGDPSVLAPGFHGIHIHEFALCDPTTVPRYATAGGHYDPGPNSNSNPDINHPFHMGDIPNLEVNDRGVGRLRATTSRITLSDGPLTVFDADNPATFANDTGRTVVVHLNPDQGMPGTAGVSGGPRIACGIIQMEQ